MCIRDSLSPLLLSRVSSLSFLSRRSHGDRTETGTRSPQSGSGARRVRTPPPPPSMKPPTTPPTSSPLTHPPPTSPRRRRREGKEEGG
eukprot:2658048-Rhodomonas_salina.1